MVCSRKAAVSRVNTPPRTRPIRTRVLRGGDRSFGRHVSGRHLVYERCRVKWRPPRGEPRRTAANIPDWTVDSIFRYIQERLFAEAAVHV